MSGVSVIREPIKVIADILKGQMSLTDQQLVLSYDKFNIPPTTGLFIALSYISGKAVGASNYQEENGVGGLREIQQVSMHHLIQIDILSFDNSARLQKEEILLALKSIFSQQAQEINNIQIARIPSEFMNASSLEETKILNRFTMTIAVKSIYSKTIEAIDYYDQFQESEVKVNE